MAPSAVRAELVPASPARPHLRGWSHLLAAVAALALCPLLIVSAPGDRGAYALYGVTVAGLFTVSGTYHRMFWDTRFRDVCRRLDHVMIFLVIAATYTPVSLYALTPPARPAVLSVVWGCAVAGTIGQVVLDRVPAWVTATLYVVMGWSILPVIHLVWQSVGVAGFALLLLGGVLHTIGAAVYAARWPDPWPRWFGFHEVFHALVVAAIAAHYVVIAFLVSP